MNILSRSLFGSSKKLLLLCAQNIFILGISPCVPESAGTFETNLARKVISSRLTDCETPHSRASKCKVNSLRGLFMCQMRFRRDLITSSGLDQTQIQSGWERTSAPSSKSCSEGWVDGWQGSSFGKISRAWRLRSLFRVNIWSCRLPAIIHRFMEDYLNHDYSQKSDKRRQRGNRKTSFSYCSA